MITISFYSYKGGVGRSLALTNLAVYVAQFGATVVMVDFDLEAPGLQYKLQPAAVPIELDTRGMAGLLADATSAVDVTGLDYDLAIDVTEYVESPTQADEELEQQRGRLLLIPAGNPLQSRYWADLARIDWTRLFIEPPRPGVAALAGLRQHILDKYNPDLLLIDSRTGITPSAGVSTTLLPDVVVPLLLNTREHLDGSRIVISAISRGAAGGGEAPRVQPVLSRYTGRRLTEQPSLADLRRRGLVPGRGGPDERIDDDLPLEEVHRALVDGLDDDAAHQVAPPLVLHTDLSLQYRERLSFGRYANEVVSGAAGTLLDDYLRLFASLVPQEMVTRHLTGVRNRIRSIILDRPDDAVRTLENLAGLVGDEGVFVDLIKVHLLRRDVASMLRAAERLFRVHGTIVVYPAISEALRDNVAVGRAQRTGPEPISLPPDFLESYWRRAAPNDSEWGVGVVRALAGVARSKRAEELSEELIAAKGTPDVLAQVVGALAAGTENAEKLAVRLAMRHFDSGASSSEFLHAAALACRYQPLPELARAIADSPGFSGLDDPLAIEVLQSAGRPDEAGALLMEALAVLDVDEGTVDRYDLERFAAPWATLSGRNKAIRAELQQRNPGIVELLDSFRELRPSRDISRRYR
jgi:hypothetical protein